MSTPTASEPRLRVIPLGGLGEIGLNFLLLECGDTAIAIDCGVMFPDESMLGVDVVIPDLTYLRTLGARFKGIFLTHGHEDHIGALPYVLPEFDVPVWGTPLTLGFVRGRMKEHGLSPDLRGDEDAPITVGPFVVAPYAMTHSIPDAIGLAIRTPLGDAQFPRQGDGLETDLMGLILAVDEAPEMRAVQI